MDERKYTILVVEDDLDVAEMLNAYFRVQGYDVLTVNWGEDAVRSCRANHPDVVILDIRLPDIDGYEVARQLRSNRRTENIPIIFLTEKRSRNDRLQGLELGADDYITKPFDVQELRLRVRNSLRRVSQGSLNNPVTNLPEGSLVEEQLQACLNKHQWALLIVSLKNLEHFRERYGFVASDDVLRAISLMVTNSLRESGSPNDFVGHLGPTELVIVTTDTHADTVKERIDSRLKQSLEYFYPLKDRGTQLGDRQLEVHIGKLSASQGPFADLDDLKTRLLRQR